MFTLIGALVGVLGDVTKLYYSYKHSMAELDEQGAWVGHASSAQFLAESKARCRSPCPPDRGPALDPRVAPTPSDEALARLSDVQRSGA